MKNYTIVLLPKTPSLAAFAFIRSIPQFGWYSKQDAVTLAAIFRSNPKWKCKIRKMTKAEADYSKALDSYMKNKS